MISPALAHILRFKPAGVDAATTAWVNAVVAAGGAVSATQQSRVDTLIKALRTHGLFSVLDRLWLHAGESDAKQATIDVIALGVATTNGTITLSAGGYTSDGSTGYLSQTFNPNTAGGQFQKDSAHIGMYMNTVSASTFYIGSQNTGGTAYAIIGDGNNATDLNDSAFAAVNITNPGLYIASRTSSAGYTVYKDRSSFSTAGNTATSVANIDQTFVMGGLKTSGGGVSNFSTTTMKCSWWGGGLDATQAGNLSDDINAYMTAWGVNTY